MQEETTKSLTKLTTGKRGKRTANGTRSRQEHQQGSFQLHHMQTALPMHQQQQQSVSHVTSRMEGNPGMYQQQSIVSSLPSIEHLAYRGGAGSHGYACDMSMQPYSSLDLRSYSIKHAVNHPFAVPQSYQRQTQGAPQANSYANPAMFGNSQTWAHFDTSLALAQMSPAGGMQAVNPQRHKRTRMSLQKRLLVNARERERMRVLNKAFEALRDALPCYIADGHMAKITTLRLAINYIKALSEVLREQRQLDEAAKQREANETENTQSHSNATGEATASITETITLHGNSETKADS